MRGSTVAKLSFNFLRELDLSPKVARFRVKLYHLYWIICFISVLITVAQLFLSRIPTVITRNGRRILHMIKPNRLFNGHVLVDSYANTNDVQYAEDPEEPQRDASDNLGKSHLGHTDG